MAKKKVSELTSVSATPAQDDILIINDVSDTTGSPQGTTKSVTVENLLSAPLPIKFGQDVGGTNFKKTAKAGELFFDITEERLYIAVTSAGRNDAYIIAISSQEAVSATTSAEGESIFNITDRSTENSLFTASYSLPSGKAIIAYGTDTEDLYVFYDGSWKTYENDL